MEALFVVLMAVVVLAVGYLALLAVYRMSRTEKTGEA
jgi:Tfp pilus assembly protein PilV